MTAKAPTPARVSATLRAADFRAVDRDGRTEGRSVTWDHVDADAVRVEFWTDDDDHGSTEGRRKADALRDDALVKMASVLRRKGWLVTEHGTALPYLLVKEA